MRRAALAEGAQLVAIGRSAGLVAERTDEQPWSRDPDRLEHIHQTGEQLRIGEGILAPDEFRTDLVELPKPALLRSLVTEHRADVVEPGNLVALVEVVLDEGACERRRPLRPQRQQRAVAVGEGVHLFLDDVGRLPDGARKEFRALDDRQPDLVEAVAFQDRGRDALDPGEQTGRLGQRVVKASHRRNRHRRRRYHATGDRQLDAASGAPGVSPVPDPAPPKHPGRRTAGA